MCYIHPRLDDSENMMLEATPTYLLIVVRFVAVAQLFCGSRRTRKAFNARVVPRSGRLKLARGTHKPGGHMG